ncbi:Putative armadillo-like helical, nuclear condensin complex subunit 3 domain-containing protein [Septoria linicola]|uniref:Armadillo-like helical, nuclear condensin complex subunit 3 domain-containing protein n=1 Tax=Septoria linicola TaxID=215465 RepID=A0A9Q9AS67_9PEZI|nr:putative armadillo-like helical, nuclear condensin complex subunit 3 domain-containing protein [Septoria linicola]USW51072.1 Putative armadillo-like helical, nuclear condensin complex subunit 3 domain-containing protein [Septoria linicola]
MPGRVASGAARTSRRTVSSKTSTRSIRNSSPAPEIPDEGEDSSLRRAVCTAFADAQKSTAGHRKAIISLRKVQEACSYEPVSSKKGKQSEDFDEEDFNREVARCVIRILPVKKSEQVGDRVVRFLGTFLNVAAGKDNEIAQADDDVEEGTLPETPTSRLATEILKMTMLAMKAKAKEIRFRATQITSHIINSLDTLDDSLFHQLRQELLKRIHDKEASVRLQAVYGLGRLAAEVEEDEDEEDSDSDDDLGGKTVLNKLLHVLQNDPSAEVRRNLLLNLPLTKEVLPYLLERARDADATTRKALYGRLLPALGDFRHLSLTHREKLLRWGMRDRDENVRKATARLFCERWIEDCAALPAAQAAEQEENGESKDKEAVPSLDALLELLERIDVVNSGGEGGIALIAMDEFWKGRPDYVDYVSFPDSFWDELSPELAFVARTFNEYCRSTTDYVGPRSLVELAEEKLPEVTKFGFLLEREIKRLIQATIASAAEEEEEMDDGELAHCEFIVEQMLQMALTFDYSDEVGRRKISVLMRTALALADLPEEVTRLVVEVLRLVCGDDAKGEREFCSVVLEAIAEVHDTIMGEDDDDADNTEDSFHSATEQLDGSMDKAGSAQKKAKKKQRQQGEADPEADEERAIREIMVNMKCLHIALCMLQNVQCDLEENVHLVTMLNNLVVPAVRSQEAPIRERGLLCLGLCCLLGKNLAQENLALFLACFSKGHPALQAIALQIITDILVVHPALLDPVEGSEEPNEAMQPVLKAFKSSLKSGDAEVQSTGATALSKAMLSRLVTDTDLLKQLVVTYFDPDSVTNAQLRQGLSYFLPVYCHSRAENAVRMAEITTSVVSKLQTLRKAFEDDDDEDVAAASSDQMVSMTQITNMLLDWTDPRKIVGFSDAVGDSSVKSGASETHFILAESILDRLVSSQLNKEEKKILFSMLNKLHLPAGGCDAERLKSVLELLQEAIDTKVASDATSKNVLSKLQTALLKLMHDVMTEERGGGDTVLETTELPDQSEVADESEIGDVTQTAAVGDATEVAEGEDDQDSDVTQLQQDMKDATLGATTGLTFGPADAEGTRIQLEYEDSEMMDVDG